MKSWKNCSNGEPCGNCGESPDGRSARACTACCEEMLTTAGASEAARSAKLSGAPRARAGAGMASGATSMAAGNRTGVSAEASAAARRESRRMVWKDLSIEVR